MLARTDITPLFDAFVAPNTLMLNAATCRGSHDVLEELRVEENRRREMERKMTQKGFNILNGRL